MGMHPSTRKGGRSSSENWQRHKCDFNRFVCVAGPPGVLRFAPRALTPFIRLTWACKHPQAQRANRQPRGDVLIDELVPVDETQALEEGQRDECMGVSDLHVARHSLDQSHEALQLRCDVIWGQGGGT